MRDAIFYMKTNVLQDFHICISVPLSISWKTIKKTLDDWCPLKGHAYLNKAFNCRVYLSMFDLLVDNRC